MDEGERKERYCDECGAYVETGEEHDCEDYYAEEEENED